MSLVRDGVHPSMTRRIYLEQNVYDAALDRIRWLFREFEVVTVGFSGGKDSTVVLNLALQVAEEMGRLPLNVLFIDQEAEWAAVIEYVRAVMHDPRVNPLWLQVPIKLFNATSMTTPWLYCWEPGKPWIREKEPDSIHENVYGTDRFAHLFTMFMRHERPDTPYCIIAGVRCEESPGRALGLTTHETYKGETWGNANDKRRRHLSFYPIYDWNYGDVWKAIHDHAWPYCSLYDAMYQYGIPTRDMRVSNVHHETAVRTLFYLQEVEPETWEAVTARLAGVNAAGHLRSDFFCPRELPPMFTAWEEYRDYLLEHLIQDPKIRASMAAQFAAHDTRWEGKSKQDLLKTEISAILVNDYHGTKLRNFHASHMASNLHRGRLSGRTEDRRND